MMKVHNFKKIIFFYLILSITSISNSEPGENAAENVLWNLVMDARSHVAESTAKFEQIVTSELLSEPAISHGVAYYVAPYFLQIHIKSPIKLLLEIRGDDIRIIHGKREESVNIQDWQKTNEHFRIIRLFLSSDKKALEKYYKIVSNGSISSWKIDLLPKKYEVISVISLFGSHGYINEIKIEKKFGNTIILKLITTSQNNL